MQTDKIAVLMTCHNRRNKTRTCLERLFLQKDIPDIRLQVFLVDDGSTDGTGAMVRKNYPEVLVLEGDGSLFWVGGMRLAFGEALKGDYDFYLWLNDDTKIHDTALRCLLDTHSTLLQASGRNSIVVGSLCDENSHRLTYGGWESRSRWRPTTYRTIVPLKEPQPCELFNGNCVLIPREAAVAIGNISSGYKHGPGDMDYAVRAAKAGFSSFICPGFVGTCTRNPLLDRWKTAGLTMKQRIDAISHPIIVARARDWIVYARRYHKLLWPYFYVTGFLQLRLPKVYILLKTGFLLHTKSHAKV